MVKVLSLNLCNYHNFEERKFRIIDFIKRISPDIVALQEVRDDLKYNSAGDNQAKQINRHLGYPYMAFVETMDINQVKDTPNAPACAEGLAILSKLPILKALKRKLKKQARDKFSRAVMHVKVASNKTIDIFNVHYSPGTLFAKLHLEETLKISKGLGISPIILGDFNIPDPKIIKELASDYSISTDTKKYLSYHPKGNIKKDKVYNLEACTLDYILIPKNCKFKYFDCRDEGLSDHNALIAEIVV